MGDASTDGVRVRTRTLGDFRLHALDAGSQKLDGGAMFGVVPKPLWQKRIPADERNRIPLALRCLLVETRDALILIDTGVGNKENERFREIYGIENASRSGHGPTQLEDAIVKAGHSPDDVDIVIDTHLHFDHAGGNTHFDAEGHVKVSFPRAKYIVQQGERDFAHLRNERISASYLPHNFDPVEAAGQYRFVHGDSVVVPGVKVVPTPGHTPYHQSVVLESAGRTACYLADLVPTTAHLPLPWIMGYDVEPLVTLETKRGLLARAKREEWLLIFEHDPEMAWGHIEGDDARPVFVDETSPGEDVP